MTWLPIAFIAPLFFVTFQALSKTLPRDISPYLVNAYASLIGFAIMIALHFLLTPVKSVALSSRSLWTALAIGGLIAIGNMLTIRAYTHGAPQSLFTMVFYISLIIYGVLTGLLIWHEKLNMAQGIGAFLSIAGIAIILYFKK